MDGIVSPRKRPVCANCYSEGADSGLKQCARCGVVKYCSRTCQSKGDVLKRLRGFMF